MADKYEKKARTILQASPCLRDEICSLAPCPCIDAIAAAIREAEAPWIRNQDKLLEEIERLKAARDTAQREIKRSDELYAELCGIKERLAGKEIAQIIISHVRTCAVGVSSFSALDAADAIHSFLIDRAGDSAHSALTTGNRKPPQ